MRLKKKLECVLLVDDDESANFLHSIVISKAKIAERVHTAENGIEALDYLYHRGCFSENGTNYPCPTLILLDINMPAMDGWEFLQEYAQLNDEVKEKITIVMLTTSLNPKDKQKADSVAEVKDFKHKPLTQDLLNEIIENHFNDYLEN